MSSASNTPTKNGTIDKTADSKETAPVRTVSKYDKLTTEDIYNLAREFVKAKEGSKAVQITYNDRNLMNVLTKQISSRKLEDEQAKVGFLDLIGKDRIQLWKALGDLSKEEAMNKYIELITKICPLFSVHLEAHKSHLEEIENNKLKLIQEEEQLRKEMTEQKEKKLREEDLKKLEENKKRREEIQRKQIQEALNQQTFPHFKAYAEQQHPNQIQAQEELIKQLQEQHFEQYMNQVYQQQLLHQQQQAEQLRAMKRVQKKNITPPPDDEQLNKLSLGSSTESSPTHVTSSNVEMTNDNQYNNRLEIPNFDNNPDPIQIQLNSTSTLESSDVKINLEIESNSDTSNQNNQVINANVNQASEPPGQNDFGQNVFQGTETRENSAEGEEDDSELPPISAASMLTRKDIKDFKEIVKKDNDAIIKVGSGETVTVRVPTHEDGRLIFWEFATDFYDLGFGLYFEWTLSPSSNVTVHVSDSSDEDDAEEEDTTKEDIEIGDKSAESNKPPCDEIIPIFRRDCHEEVYAGSHLYPGRGVYLLKFDNSYSLWRSKTLYYRVYYSK